MDFNLSLLITCSYFSFSEADFIFVISGALHAQVWVCGDVCMDKF